nr:hypothetical protein [uncultured Mediterranean phage uvMED]
MSYTNGLDNPELYFQTKLYSGTGSTNSVTFDGSENMQPDWVWIKARSNSDQPHALFDSVRGVNKVLYSNNTDAEDDDSANGSLTSFDSDGFTVGGFYNRVNQSGETFVSWNWKASGSTASNTDGSITSTVSANTTAGFSIVSYTGTGSAATIGHGLNSEAKMVIVKERSGADAWIVGHSSIGFTKNLLLNATNAEFADSTIWNNTSPTSSVFSVGSSASTNQSSATYIAYCFADVKGYSKFGSYTGNGNADGTFVYLGFKPAWLVVKNIVSATDSWHTKNNKSSPFNVVDDALYLNMSIAELTNNSALNVDFLSNGFKLRTNNTASNGSGTSYIYMAFAENPFVTSSSVPATAR